MSESDATKAMADDLRKDAKVLQVKRRILKILSELPDDESRRRALGAAAVLLGHADVVLKP